jgi:hypothetical protein
MDQDITVPGTINTPPTETTTETDGNTVPGTISTHPAEADGNTVPGTKKKRGRPRNDGLHEAAAEYGMTARQAVEGQGIDLVKAIWPDARHLPVKVLRELGLVLSNNPQAIGYAIHVLELRAAGEHVRAEEIAAAIRQSYTALDTQLARAHRMLAGGWTAQTVAASLRRERVDARGDTGDREYRAAIALFNMAQQRAAQLPFTSTGIGTVQLLEAALAMAKRTFEVAS